MTVRDVDNVDINYRNTKKVRDFKFHRIFFDSIITSLKNICIHIYKMKYIY